MAIKTVDGCECRISELKGILRADNPVGYKVVTADMRSLGLRRNPNIIEYPINRWLFLPKKEVVRGKEDYGGIWVARALSAANKLSEYMRERYGRETRIFRARLNRVLYSNSYRIKTDGIILLEEIGGKK